MRKEENGKDRHQDEDENANNVENRDQNDDETDEYDAENNEYDAENDEYDTDDDEYDKEDGEYDEDDEIHTTGEKYELFWLLKSSPLPALLVSHMIILIIIQPELMGPFRTFVI